MVITRRSRAASARDRQPENGDRGKWSLGGGGIRDRAWGSLTSALLTSALLTSALLTSALLTSACSRSSHPPPAVRPAPAPRVVEPAPPAPPQGEPRSEADWCVSGGAGLAGAPLADAEGRLYFATLDGTLHAYEADGRYRFAFTLVGTPLGAPCLKEDDGTLLVGTSERLLYAVSQAGALRWRASTSTPLGSSIVPRQRGEIVFVGRDGWLYALGTGGRAHFRVKLPGRAQGEPLAGAGGRLWVPLADGLARIEGEGEVRHFPLGGRPESLVIWGSGIAVRTDDGLVRELDGEGRELARRRGVAMASAGGHHVVVESPESLLWLDAGGERRLALGLPEGLVAEPWLGDDWLALPLDRGWLGWLRADGQRRLSWLGRAALGRPIPAGERLFVPDAEGRVCAVSFPVAGDAGVR